MGRDELAMMLLGMTPFRGRIRASLNNSFDPQEPLNSGEITSTPSDGALGARGDLYPLAKYRTPDGREGVDIAWPRMLVPSDDMSRPEDGFKTVLGAGALGRFGGPVPGALGAMKGGKLSPSKKADGPGVIRDIDWATRNREQLSARYPGLDITDRAAAAYDRRLIDDLIDEAIMDGTDWLKLQNIEGGDHYIQMTPDLIAEHMEAYRRRVQPDQTDRILGAVERSGMLGGMGAGLYRIFSGRNDRADLSRHTLSVEQFKKRFPGFESYGGALPVPSGFPIHPQYGYPFEDEY